MSALGLPVTLGSSECRGTGNLPLHAAYAVRYGWSAEDALAAMTTVPARTFHLDDVGSLQKGRDADFVVFSGSMPVPVGAMVDLRVAEIDRKLKARFVEVKDGGAYLQLPLNHEHLDYMSQALTKFQRNAA